MTAWGDVSRPSTMTEHEAAEYIAALYRLEADPDCEQAVVKLGPASAFLLIAALQLAMRHPEMTEATRGRLAVIIDQLAPLFHHTPGAALLELGNHAVYDIPTACRYPFGAHAPGCPPGDHLPFGMPAAMPASGLDGCSCTGPHPAEVHDDGFGCTMPGCPCVADRRGQ